MGRTVRDESVVFNYSSFFNLLIVKPDCKDSYNTIAILNYYGFPHTVEDDFRRRTSLEFGYKQNSTYPILSIDSSLEAVPSCDYVTKDEILSGLFKMGLIPDYRSHSAYEKQGLKFSEEILEPAFDDLMRNFIPNL